MRIWIGDPLQLFHRGPDTRGLRVENRGLSEMRSEIVVIIYVACCRAWRTFIGSNKQLTFVKAEKLVSA